MGDVINLDDDESIEVSEKRKLPNVPKATGDDNEDPNCNKRLKIEDEKIEPEPSPSEDDPKTEPGGSIPAGEEPKIGGSDDEDEDYEEGGCKENPEAVVDRKGKGLAVDYKGKGKVFEESDEEDEDDYGDDDDDDSSDDDDDFSDGLGGGEDSGDDLEEDPLAEVDLDNILPSRTRQGGGGRARSGGVRIAGDDKGKGK